MIDSLADLALRPVERSALAGAWGIASFASFNVVGSTQDIVRSLAEDGAPEWTLVVADYQTGGRGQHGRSWLAEAGASLMFSFLLRPASPEEAALVPVRCGLLIAAALDPFLHGASVALKWPNDLVLDSGKLGGILCEAQTRGNELSLAVGVGINVRTMAVERADGLLAPAFLDARLRAGATRLELLGAIITALRNGLPGCGPVLSPEELAGYHARDWLIGRSLVAPLAGTAAGIDRLGHLIVKGRDGAARAAVAGRVELEE